MGAFLGRVASATRRRAAVARLIKLDDTRGCPKHIRDSRENPEEAPVAA
jgi:hypothetical protein